MKKVISFSLWGTNKKYTIGAIENAKLALEYYPGWICRYYIASSVPKEIISDMGTSLVWLPKLSLTTESFGINSPCLNLKLTFPVIVSLT